jgi:hypothetical protein
MSLRSRARVLAAVALGAVPWLGHALDVNGALGGGFSRSGTATPDISASTSSWDWVGNLAVGGIPVDPGILTLQAGASYQGRQDLYTGSKSRSNGLGFDASAGVLFASPLPLTLSASRGVSQFTSDIGAQQTGSTLTSTYGVSALNHSDGRPTLTAGASHVDSVNSSFGQPDRNTSSTSVRLGATQRLQSLGYTLGYDTSWSGGAFADTNFRSHNFAGEASAAVTRDMDVGLTDHYTLRAPTVDASSNPRLESHTLGAGFGWGRSSDVTSRADYGYSRGLVQAPGTPDQESVSHALGYSLTWRRSPSVLFSATLGSSLVDERLGDVRARSAAETVGGGATWSTDLAAWQLQLSGNLSTGLQQPRGGPTQGAYGGGGGVQLGTARWGWSGSIGYHLSYADGLTAGSARTFSHGATLTGNGTPWSRGSLQLTASADATRRDDVLFGTGMTRSVSLLLSASWRSLSGSLNAGLNDGLSATLRTGGVADGLLLSPGYDSHVRLAGASLSWAVTSRLTMGVAGHALDSVAPGRPDTYEVGASGSLGYSIGSFTLQLQDNVSQGGSGGAWYRANIVMMRLTRAFGARFF